MGTVLISPADSNLLLGFNRLRFETLRTDGLPALSECERHHADMQLLVIGDTAFAAPCKNMYIYKKYFSNVFICAEGLSASYPDNVALNCALVGNRLICRSESTDKTVLAYCKEGHIDIIDVNQGYAKCSTAVITDNAIITADVSICRAAEKAGIETLLIEPGHIRLDGADYGFIGGCTQRIGETVYFTGNVLLHPQGKEITDFITAHGLGCVCVTSGVLNDIGGIIPLC